MMALHLEELSSFWRRSDESIQMIDVMNGSVIISGEEIKRNRLIVKIPVESVHCYKVRVERFVPGILAELPRKIEEIAVALDFDVTRGSQCFELLRDSAP